MSEHVLPKANLRSDERAKLTNIVMAAALAALSACTKKAPESMDGAQALVERGKRSYLSNCTACHSSDPHKDGAIGPAVAGSSLDLLRARILDAGYPPGYKPKRDTKAMAALPHLKGDVEALAAFLEAP